MNKMPADFVNTDINTLTDLARKRNGKFMLLLSGVGEHLQRNYSQSVHSQENPYGFMGFSLHEIGLKMSS